METTPGTGKLILQSGNYQTTLKANAFKPNYLIIPKVTSSITEEDGYKSSVVQTITTLQITQVSHANADNPTDITSNFSEFPVLDIGPLETVIKAELYKKWEAQKKLDDHAAKVAQGQAIHAARKEDSEKLSITQRNPKTTIFVSLALGASLTLLLSQWINKAEL